MSKMLKMHFSRSGLRLPVSGDQGAAYCCHLLDHLALAGGRGVERHRQRLEPRRKYGLGQDVRRCPDPEAATRRARRDSPLGGDGVGSSSRSAIDDARRERTFLVIPWSNRAGDPPCCWAASCSRSNQDEELSAAWLRRGEGTPSAPQTTRLPFLFSVLFTATGGC